MQERRPRLNLPFVKRHKDIGTVVYDHRAGIFAVVIAALVMAIVFVASRITLSSPDTTEGILVDLRTLEELQAEKDRLEREVRMRQSEADFSQIRNAVSNEGAELRDDRSTDMHDMQERLDAANDRMNANSNAWDQGMQDIEKMKNDRRGNEKKENAGGDTRAKGRVLVSFSLVAPTRYKDNLVVPGYRCEGGGEVVVDIVVDRAGTLVSAVVNRSLSDSDACMHSTALDAARRSRFTPDGSAPDRQSGTITYTFIPQ
jgi:TonB family protein